LAEEIAKAKKEKDKLTARLADAIMESDRLRRNLYTLSWAVETFIYLPHKTAEDVERLKWFFLSAQATLSTPPAQEEKP
jgi:hypothetical protein